MIALSDYNYISPEKYLQIEENSPIKHEYRQGQIYAMAGASNIHVMITGNIFALIRNHLRGTGCNTYISDTKIDLQNLNTYYYPDVVVTCDERDKKFTNFIRYPQLIIEVLSSTTEGFDRGDKFADYRQIETLKEYVLISQNRPFVEIFRLNQQNRWELYSYQENSEIYLSSIDFHCGISAIYEDVSFIK
jgi:Uma2 family endonuclease